MENVKHPERWFGHVLTMPLMWWPLLPLLIMDLSTEVYMRVCFPVYGITLVKRGDYVIIDRHKLQYLNFFQKVGCVYCGYTNGVLKYMSVVAGETEKYWCGIMHGRGTPLEHQKDFLPYDNQKAYEDYVKEGEKSE